MHVNLGSGLSADECGLEKALVWLWRICLNSDTMLISCPPPKWVRSEIHSHGMKLWLSNWCCLTFSVSGSAGLLGGSSVVRGRNGREDHSPHGGRKQREREKQLEREGQGPEPQGGVPTIPLQVGPVNVACE